MCAGCDTRYWGSCATSLPATASSAGAAAPLRAATACRRREFTLVKQQTLKWYVAVPGFRRGFCSECGSSLFFEQDGGERVSIAAGTLDKPQG